MVIVQSHRVLSFFQLDYNRLLTVCAIGEQTDSPTIHIYIQLARFVGSGGNTQSIATVCA